MGLTALSAPVLHTNTNTLAAGPSIHCYPKTERVEGRRDDACASATRRNRRVSRTIDRFRVYASRDEMNGVVGTAVRGKAATDYSRR